MSPIANSVRHRKGLVTAALMIFIFIAGMVQAQVRVSKSRIADVGLAEPVTVKVPRVIRGQAVESVVINHVVLVFGVLVVAEGPAAANAPADPPTERKPQVLLFSGTFDELVYGNGSNADTARSRLENRLQKKLEAIDRIIGLNDSQRQKLHLAGRGDLKRLFDRAEKLRAMCDDSAEIADLNQFQKWTEDLKREAAALRYPFDAGPFDTDSLMAKCMKTALAPEQVSKFYRFEATPPYQHPERRPGRFEGAIELR
jgi:hypothetical protein